jgi:hypothetical protein
LIHFLSHHFLTIGREKHQHIPDFLSSFLTHINRNTNWQSAMVFQQQQTMTTAAEFPASNGTSTSDRPKNGLHPDPLANFLVEPARKEHLAEINEFLFTDFLTTEPLNASVGLTREESADFFNCKQQA